MRFKHKRVALFCMLALSVSAEVSSTAMAQSLTGNEAKGTTLSGKWRGQAGLVTRGPDGKVIFLFGETQPSVVCSPLQVCDIELQGGEIVRDALELIQSFFLKPWGESA